MTHFVNYSILTTHSGRLAITAASPHEAERMVKDTLPEMLRTLSSESSVSVTTSCDRMKDELQLFIFEADDDGN